MRQNIPAQPLAGARLTRQDLIGSEHALKDALQAFVGFKSYSLYFPPPGSGPASGEPEFLRGEQRLLLPLVHQGELIGM
ncbi:MAG: hypothetical protein ACLGQW_03810, partial [Acidobacteriota bacterium]